ELALRIFFHGPELGQPISQLKYVSVHDAPPFSESCTALIAANIGNTCCGTTAFPKAFSRGTRFFIPTATLGGSHSYCGCPSSAGHRHPSSQSESPSSTPPNPDSTVLHFLPSFFCALLL